MQGVNLITNDLVGQVATWFQEQFTKPDTKDFIKERDMHKQAVEMLDDILSDMEDELTIRETEELRSAIVTRIHGKRFRVNVFHKLLKDPTIPVAVTFVNKRCVEDREHWGDIDTAHALRKSWMPKKRDPGFAFVHNSAAGICAAERQSKSAAGSMVTAFKRLISWVMRDLYADDAKLAAARMAAAGQVLAEHFKYDENFTDERDRLVDEYREAMAVNG